MKTPVYYGHASAMVLRCVKKNRWIQMNLGRTITHVRTDGTRIVMNKTHGKLFASCTACSTFAEIDYIRYNDAFCSSRCAHA